MAENDFEIESIGEVYAQALVNLAQKNNVLAEVTEDIRSLRELVEMDKTFAAFLAAVTIPEDQKIKSLKKVLEGASSSANAPNAQRHSGPAGTPTGVCRGPLCRV